MQQNGYDVPVILVVHTNCYAGNFERELGAFATGVVGECSKGEREARTFREEFGDEVSEDVAGHVRQYIADPDDDSCARPVALWWNKYGQPNSVAIFFDQWPEEYADLITQRVKDYAGYHYNHGTWSGHKPGDGEKLQILGIELVNRSITVNDSAKVLA